MTEKLSLETNDGEASPRLKTKPFPLFFVHGWWGGSWVWNPMLAAFRSLGYECHAIDLRGAKEEIAADDLGRLTVTDHVEEILAAIDSLKHPVLIGHSFGGLLIQKVLEKRSAAAAVLLGPAAPRGIVALRSWGLVRNAIQLAPRMLLRKPFLPSREAMIELNLNCVEPALHEEILSSMVPASGRQGLQTALLGVPVDEKRIDTPMLVISGQHDRLTPPAIGKAIAAKYGADFRLYSEHGHFFMREPQADRIVEDIADWIDRHAKALS